MSFVNALSGPQISSISVKPVSLFGGEPIVHFFAAKIQIMVEPFKLSLVGKFSFGHPSMDLIRKFFLYLGLKGCAQISLLDNRHLLIKLHFEENYSRIWSRQTWYSKSMCIFKWSISFRCFEEYHVAHVWVSLPYLPVHFIHYKDALFSIVNAIGKPL